MSQRRSCRRPGCGIAGAPKLVARRSLAAAAAARLPFKSLSISSPRSSKKLATPVELDPLDREGAAYWQNLKSWSWRPSPKHGKKQRSQADHEKSWSVSLPRAPSSAPLQATLGQEPTTSPPAQTQEALKTSRRQLLSRGSGMSSSAPQLRLVKVRPPPVVQHATRPPSGLPPLVGPSVLEDTPPVSGRRPGRNTNLPCISSDPDVPHEKATQDALRPVGHLLSALGPVLPQLQAPTAAWPTPKTQSPASPCPPAAAEPARSSVVEEVIEVCKLRKELAVPLDSIKSAFYLFKAHATVPQQGALISDGYCTKASLAALMARMAGSSVVDQVEMNKLIEDVFRTADKDWDGRLCFREFAIWWSTHGFGEDQLHLESAELELRKMGRKLGVDAVNMDFYKRHFDILDLDSSGQIDFDEFEPMLYKCLHIPRHIGLPQSRVHQLWMAADADGGGGIDLEEFVVFYKKYFAQVGDSNGFERYYSSGIPASVLQIGSQGKPDNRHGNIARHH